MVVAQLVGQELRCPHHRCARAHGRDRLTDRRLWRRGGSDPTTSATTTRRTAQRVVRRAKPGVLRAEHERGRVDARSAVRADRRGARRPELGEPPREIGGRQRPAVRARDLGGGQVARARDVARLRVDGLRLAAVARRGAGVEQHAGAGQLRRGVRVEHRHGAGSDDDVALGSAAKAPRWSAARRRPTPPIRRPAPPPDPRETRPTAAATRPGPRPRRSRRRRPPPQSRRAPRRAAARPAAGPDPAADAARRGRAGPRAPCRGRRTRRPGCALRRSRRDRAARRGATARRGPRPGPRRPGARRAVRPTSAATGMATEAVSRGHPACTGVRFAPPLPDRLVP